jgi:phage-related protein
LSYVVKYDNAARMPRNTRPISWIKAARKDFDNFPFEAQTEAARALTILAEGQMPDIAKPLAALGSGVMELAPGIEGTLSAMSTHCRSALTSG